MNFNIDSFDSCSYHAGDVVLFHLVRKKNSTFLNLMHLERARPLMIMDSGCYGSLGVRSTTKYVLAGSLIPRPPWCFLWFQTKRLERPGDKTMHWHRFNPLYPQLTAKLGDNSINILQLKHVYIDLA